ncbi:guanylate kinase [Lactiplantibacillus mudanjiangensis]|uniref:Guanylate kinase [Lactobacillus paraplantarum] n=1 Tax=Lactiplantibacillus mudanjiangensis TaxID=1296538 RepID=A0A660E147_9LACO|nr:AAA family ATPase [Lactiplantibacillus mudanjiangensis]VDG17837.1 guanylate kinase [Lactobacillus paraplantarum] [Lactiplantibacillus mudanjiangensis]VDG23283.1 guanylate kinase [Lactobacillus paraplantarum] [Lactiplantibacillus mudanjiangensis]VDG28244.1 guanylate kinase [Lactobacillus paraplantarum] [Lactiplantibacillus mudanjiangensis]VDG32465.1 guanylate kinase [Lactobacillus paraplantarum] [Lactiplantibacillus mudanjiangensis]
MTTQRVLVVTGPTGSGKTTVCRYLLEKYQIPQVITHTTRAPRTGETNNVDYYFETPASFATKHYLEHVTYSGNQYGSSREGLAAAWEKSPLISIVLDTAGAVTYAEALGDQAVIVYLEVTEQAALIDRLTARGDAAERIQKRVASDEYARDQQLPASLVGHAQVIVNDDWAQTAAALDALVAKYRIA